MKCTFCQDKRQVRARLGSLAFAKPTVSSAATPSSTRYMDKDARVAQGFALVPCPRCQAQAPAPKPDPLDTQPDLTRGQLMWLKGIGRDKALASRRNGAIMALESKGLIRTNAGLWEVTPSGRARLAALEAGVPGTWRWHR